MKLSKTLMMAVGAAALTYGGLAIAGPDGHHKTEKQVEVIKIDKDSGEKIVLSGAEAMNDPEIAGLFTADGGVDMDAVKAFKEANPGSKIKIKTSTSSHGEKDVRIHKMGDDTSCNDEMAFMMLEGGPDAPMPPRAPDFDFDMETFEGDMEKFEAQMEKFEAEMEAFAEAKGIHKEIIVKRLGPDGEAKVMHFGDGEFDFDFGDDGRTIVLSDNVVVDIDSDGSVEILRDGEAIDVLTLEGGYDGSRAGTFIIKNKSADISVDKDVKVVDGKRKVRVTIDMETEAE